MRLKRWECDKTMLAGYSSENVFNGIFGFRFCLFSSIVYCRPEWYARYGLRACALENALTLIASDGLLEYTTPMRTCMARHRTRVRECNCVFYTLILALCLGAFVISAVSFHHVNNQVKVEPALKLALSLPLSLLDCLLWRVVRSVKSFNYRQFTLC